MSKEVTICLRCGSPLSEKEKLLHLRSGLALCADCASEFVRDVIKWLQPILDIIEKARRT